ncbi:MAG: hypothetical protein JNK63_06495 [Chthonomonas sp.]|nr:hypothetical protein [Chthonomonas sp.]
MMISALLTTLVTLAPVDVTCPIMGHKAPDNPTEYSDFAGVRYAYCCGGCEGTFEKDMSGAMAKVISKGKVAGQGLFDPISRLRIQAKNAKASSDYKGVRYYFAKATDKAKFDKAPATFATAPAKESLTCPVMGDKMAGYDDAWSYRDLNGVRFYLCCGSCTSEFGKNPTKYAAKFRNTIKAPSFLK